MMKPRFLSFVVLFLISCGSSTSGGGGEDEGNDGDEEQANRDDGATQIDISASGSLQNPAWSPDSSAILFTRFRSGYNEEPADLLIVDLADNSLRTLVSDGSGNVNLPGSSWNAMTGEIVFSSSRDPHDEIFVIDEDGSAGDEEQVTERDDRVAFEPSLAPDGQHTVFESHELDVEGNGIITKFKLDGSEGYTDLTDEGDDCRQPNWSPTGDLIVYQCLAGGGWDLWVMATDGTGKRQVTGGSGDKTDASFSPDGDRLVYSSDEGGLEFADIFVISANGGSSTQVTTDSAYDGAPSWSPDGTKIAFESTSGDPDGSDGSTLWIIDAP